MTLEDFARLVPGLPQMNHVDKIKYLAWYLLTKVGKERFGGAEIRDCYDKLHYVLPANITSQLQQMADAGKPKLLKDSRGYRLEGSIKEQLDAKYGTRPETVAVAAALQSLPGRVSDQAERLFLSEALSCFHVRAFRAAIVMTWNLAYDHLVTWLFDKHLSAFNTAIPVRYPKKGTFTIGKREDFEELKESEVIEICGTAGVIGGNTKRILNEKLTKRNMAAHPSPVEIGQHQAEDVITDLVNNVILTLA